MRVCVCVRVYVGKVDQFAEKVGLMTYKMV